MLMPMNGSGMEILSMCVNIIAHDHTAGNQIINPVIAPGFLFPTLPVASQQVSCTATGHHPTYPAPSLTQFVSRQL